MISPETIEAVKRQASLLDVVQELVPLKRTGGRFVGLCPFHGEKSPSFHVRDDEHYFHCFGCGKSGNTISFVMETKGLTFPEAVEYLAEKFNIPIKRIGGKYKPKEQSDLRPKLYDLNNLAQQFFITELKKRVPDVVSYARERMLVKESFDVFGIGYAPFGNELLKFFESRKVPQEIMIRSGLIKRNDRGHLYDALRGRLTFPIFVDQKKIAGFGGRIIPALFKEGEKPPKYLNSPESDIYQKSEILYGLPQALDAIRQKGEVFVVEGYLDVIGLHQGGVHNVVATCGTALTPQHVKKLSRVAKRVVMLFDGDVAGRTAAGKSFKTFASAPIDVWAVYLPPKEDPDSIARAAGSQTSTVLDGFPRMHLVDAYIDYLLSLQKVSSVASLGSQGLNTIAQEVAEVIATVAQKTARMDLVKRAAFRLGVDESLLKSSSKGVSRPVLQTEQRDESSEGAALQSSPMAIPPIAELSPHEREMLKLAMGKKEDFVPRILKDFEVFESLQPSVQEFIQELAEVMQLAGSDGDKKEHVRLLLTSYGASWLELWKHAYHLAQEHPEKLEQTFRDVKSRIQALSRRRQIDDLSEKARICTDPLEKAQVLQQVVMLRKLEDTLRKSTN
jgi:DNA primase